MRYHLYCSAAAASPRRCGRLPRSQYFPVESSAQHAYCRASFHTDPATAKPGKLAAIFSGTNWLCRPAHRGSPIAEVSVEDIKALADHVDAELLPSTASRKLPEWVAKLQDAVALNCCKGDASGERAAQ